MKFCLEFWSIFVRAEGGLWLGGEKLAFALLSISIAISIAKQRPTFPHPTQLPSSIQNHRLTKTLDKTSSSGVGSQGKVVELGEFYKFAMES